MIKLQLFYEILFCLEGKGIIFKMTTTLTENIVWGLFCVQTGNGLLFPMVFLFVELDLSLAFVFLLNLVFFFLLSFYKNLRSTIKAHHPTDMKIILSLFAGLIEI